MDSRVARLAAAMAFALALTTLSAGRVAACRCLTPNEAQAMAIADVAFEGEVTAVILQPQPHGPAGAKPAVVYRFTVDTPVKGPIERGPVNVAAWPEMRGCGIDFTPGERWVILATAVDASTLFTDACSGSHLIGEAQLASMTTSTELHEVPIQVLGIAAALSVMAIASALAFGVGLRPRRTR